jgi:hypothetical protein
MNQTLATIAEHLQNYQDVQISPPMLPDQEIITLQRRNSHRRITIRLKDTILQIDLTLYDKTLYHWHIQIDLSDPASLHNIHRIHHFWHKQLDKIDPWLVDLYPQHRRTSPTATE